MKKALCLFLVCSILIILCSCGTSEDVVGTWKASWTYNGHSFEKTMVIEKNGKASCEIIKDGVQNSARKGTWHIEEWRSEVYLEVDFGDDTYSFDIEDGHLINGEHVYTRVSK